MAEYQNRVTPSFTSTLERSSNPVLRWIHSTRVRHVRCAALRYAGRDKSFLDYGCGDGALVRGLYCNFGFAAGVDNGHDKLAAAQLYDYPSHVKFVHTDNLLDLLANAPNGFDVIVSSQVLEHVSDATRLEIIDNMERLSHPHTRIIIEVPIESGPILLVKFLGGLALRMWTRGSYRRDRYTVKEVIQRLRLRTAPHHRPPHPRGGYYGHKDFSVWNLKQFLEQRFVIDSITFIPFHLARWWNLQAMFVCSRPHGQGGGLVHR